ncbi:calcium-binding protein [Nitrosomonas sp. sh817]|uniref:calcium-binding protein n=1 Tax=Nitrosomonas sp. sh817 TaxID=3070658 RepID=UPI0027DE936E|nr:calcium-binding protein [Nitrosomonas sp. sh817]WMJ09929.1 calcium-binding protein [Nitrosomonas sp. sh817]
MGQQIEYFKQAELALAAYANFTSDIPTQAELRDADFSTSQANIFASTYRIADRQYNDPITGLSATVFIDKVSGETFLAVRGTEINDVRDFATGVFDIMLFGSTQLHPQYHSLKAKVTEWLNDGTLSPTFTVTGHSMGGFLAIGLADDPLFTNNVSHAYLFNAPGLGGFTGPFINTVLDWMGLAPAYDQSKISNIIAATGVSPIAGLGFDVAPPVDIIIEDQMASDISNPPGARNHSQQVLTDALAIYSIFSQLAPSLELPKLSSLVDAFGSTKDVIGASNSKTLEAALDALRIIILNSADGKIALADTQKTETGNRDKFYSSLYELQNSAKFQELAGKAQLTMLSDLSPGEFITKLERNDQQGLAARFALVALNPFILENENLDYSIFNGSDALARFDPVSGNGALTSAYLVDRMTMLIRKNWFNTEDKNPLDSSVTFSSNNHSFQNINDYFEDVTSGYKISQGELTAETPRYFFGGGDADNPAASAVEDHLYGGGGDDTLKGLEGNDYLEGGFGVDTYIINPGHGTDTVLDTDGLGVIQFGAVIAQGRSGVGSNKNWIKVGGSWMDLQNDLVYLLVAQENGSNDLLVSFVGSSNSARVRIKNWSDGKLGITLGDNAPADTPVLDHVITGDLKPEEPMDYDELGNLIVGAEEDPDREDFLYGSAENDHIRGRGGNDEIDGKDGKDRIEGGSGDDMLTGGVGDDIVLGGSGNDIVKGHLHNDRLYADTEYSLDTAYLLSNTQTGTGKRGDLLDGYTGDDTLIGDAGDDILMGGHGNDILISLGGDDTIEGDCNIELADRDWKVTRSTDTKDKLITYLRDYKFSVSPAETAMISGGDDVISSGAGRDWIFAGGGNDFVDTGSDSDVTFGDAGNDTILGNDGDDALFGDNHPSRVDPSLHGNDYLNGGSGNDQLIGFGGSDYLSGDAGRDILVGDDNGISLQFHGDDYLDGGNDDDLLIGGGGSDTLVGGTGNDGLFGGAGNDIYIDVEAGDFISDLEGQNTILLAETNTAIPQADFSVKFNADPQDSVAATAAANAATSGRLMNLAWSGETSTLQIFLNTGGTLDLQDALYGMNAQFQFDHGRNSIDLEAWVSENLHQAVVLNLSTFAGNTEQPVTKAYGGKGADLIQGGINNDTINGYGGDDYLLSGGGDDKLMGGSGNDALFGQAGSDSLQGSIGDDLLTGGSGDDIFMFNLGDGADTIIIATADDAVGDMVQLGAGIAATDLRFFKLADSSLMMRIAGTQDSILFKDWFTQGPNVAALRLSDSSLIDANKMAMLATGILGGTMGDDILTGTAADDHIEGYAGNDSLEGNEGNDLLLGGDGVDSYPFGWNSLGDDVVVEDPTGANTIKLTADTSLNDLRHVRTGDDLVLMLRGGGTTLTLKDYFQSEQIWNIHADNDVVVDLAEWLSKPKPTIDITQLKTDFLDAAHAQWLNDLRNNAGDPHFGLYTRIDDTTYRGRSISENEVRIAEQRFTIIDTVNDAPTIRRLSDGLDSSVTTVNLVQPPPLEIPEDLPPFEQRFISILEWHRITNNQGLPIGVTSINGMYPVYDGDILIGFIADNRFPETPDAIRSFLQTTVAVDTQIERIEGSAGDNIIEGFKKGNFYQSSNGSGHSDLIRGSEISLIDGGGGNDTLYASGTIRLNDEVFYFADTAPNLGGFLYGNSGNDKLYGSYARDTLIGGDGNDYLDGRFSQDTYGVFADDSGVDTIWDSGTQLWQIKNTGAETLESYLYLSNRLEPRPIAQDTLKLFGVDPDHIRFAWGQRVVEGARDYWQGAVEEFADVLYSQTAHATLIMSWAGGGVEIVLPNSTDLPGMGLERVQFDDGTVLTLPELLALAAPVPELNPQDTDNLIAGRNENDVIYGEGGNDTLNGNGGDDVLNGGTGNDFLTGGSGNDVYLFGKNSGHDTVNSYDTGAGKIDTILLDYGIFPDDIRLSRSGNNLVLTIISSHDTLTVQNYLENDGITPFSVERITFNENGATWDLATVKTKLANSNQAPVLLAAIPDQSAFEGTVFNFSIDPGAFIDFEGDTLRFVASLADGNPLPAWLHFDEITRTFSGIPITSDTLSIMITANDVENLAVSDTFDINIAAQNLTLSGTSKPDILTGGNGNDMLSGFAGNDVLEGKGGDDRLNGGKGIDIMTGGAGNDIYWTDHLEDNVIEYPLEGIDIIRSSISYALTSNVENLILTGTEKITGSGNELDNELTGNSADNVLIGNAGNDKLDGKSGADIMYGGDDDDIYIVNHPGDLAVEPFSGGHDTVIASVAYTLGDHLENLTLSGASAIAGAGNSENNAITGNKAANDLWGRAGDDSLFGDGGADTLYGETGNDTLDGGYGKDILVGGVGNDSYVFGRGYGKDTIIEDDSAIDTADRVTFLPAINPDQIWFQHIGDNLEVSIIGTHDKLIINDWYLKSNPLIEQFTTANGFTVQHQNIENLVTVMATLARPETGQTDLPAGYEAVLDPLISALWLA